VAGSAAPPAPAFEPFAPMAADERRQYEQRRPEREGAEPRWRHSWPIPPTLRPPAARSARRREV